MGRVVKFLGYIALWLVILGGVILLATHTRTQHKERIVKSLNIIIADSTDQGNLVSSQMVRGMLRSNKIDIIGQKISQIPLPMVESVIEKNGFVKGVEAYINYEGEMTIEVKQRSAALRLLLNGYNCYITSDGFIFDAPTTTALYTSVVTGGYRPLFKAGYTGYVDDCAKSEIEKIELEIERVERMKYPIYLREKENAEDRREVRKRFINRSVFESKDNFAKRVADLRDENQKLRELYAYRQRIIDKELEQLEREQQRYREQQKKVQKKCDDIHNLITFVKMVENDKFWNSEVVQIDLEEGRDGMRVNIAVRSAKFIVTIGELSSDKDEIEDKFKRLKEFYNEALTRVGWDRYRYINIEYKNQVVCRR